MRDAHPTERAVGIDYYVSDADGTGGRLRDEPEDFRVREIEAVDTEPLAADGAAYEHLVIRATLRDWDTNAFARELSDRLGISRERVAWAGTKDKRALTTQLLSIDGVDPGDLPPIGDADLDPVGRLGRALRFGDLAGNAFDVRVRGADRPGNADRITDELRSFGGDQVGVPNVFGQQRFGSRRPVTHAVGLRIVRRDWKGAVMTYLGDPHEAEPDGTREARRFVEETEDWSAALERMPRRLHHERAMLHSLASTGGATAADYRTALEALPVNLQRLFVHAAQSFVFNRIISERLNRGLPFDRAVEGDVACFVEERGGLVIPDVDRLQRAEGDRVEAVNRHAERGRAYVTAPLVGTDSALGEGEPGEIERGVLEAVGVAPADFDLPGVFGSTGTRRAILLRTDVEVASDPLRFSFALPKGAYATVVLREYLKASPLSMG